jgi:hypothetical protein
MDFLAVVSVECGTLPKCGVTPFNGTVYSPGCQMPIGFYKRVKQKKIYPNAHTKISEFKKSTRKIKEKIKRIQKGVVDN